jgi:hypothetical protein
MWYLIANLNCKWESYLQHQNKRTNSNNKIAPKQNKPNNNNNNNNTNFNSILRTTPPKSTKHTKYNIYYRNNWLTKS